MEENRIYYVGIDHGNHLMKTSNHVFENGVERQAVKPTFQANTLVYDGAFYKIGEKRNSVKDSKLADDDYYLLTLAALAKECHSWFAPLSTITYGPVGCGDVCIQPSVGFAASRNR